MSLSSVATRWVLDRPAVSAAIVGARTARHLPTTLEVFSFALDTKDVSAIHDFLDPSRSLDERFPVRGGGAATEKAWIDGAKNSLASALAAAFSKTILAPFDTIKTLQQYHQTL